jgi:hypothetical protein
MARIITIEIDQETGDLTVDLEGYQGKGCTAVQGAFSRTLRPDVNGHGWGRGGGNTRSSIL